MLFFPDSYDNHKEWDSHVDRQQPPQQPRGCMGNKHRIVKLALPSGQTAHKIQG